MKKYREDHNECQSKRDGQYHLGFALIYITPKSGPHHNLSLNLRFHLKTNLNPIFMEIC